MSEQQVPARIWVAQSAGWVSDPCGIIEGDVKFIRADIAERMAEALAGVVRASESGRDTIGFMIDLQRAAVECAAALSAFRSAIQDTEARHD